MRKRFCVFLRCDKHFFKAARNTFRILFWPSFTPYETVASLQTSIFLPLSHSLSFFLTQPVLCILQKILLFYIQVDLQIAIFYESLSLWGFALYIFISVGIHLQMKPLQKCVPALPGDRTAPHCSPAWERRSRTEGARV